MKYWGAAIPGLTMNAKELPEIPGLLRLDNPEIGRGYKFGRFYTIEEAAQCHANHLCEQREILEENFTLMGMSMGGMLLSILATELRAKLPAQCRFRFIVTSPNATELPALPWSSLLGWIISLPRTQKKMERQLKHFFGPQFQNQHPEKLQDFFRSIATGENEQSLPALVRQIHALRYFKGRKYFPRVNPKDAVFIGGGCDKVLGPKHSALLRALVPGAIHRELPSLGHMVHLEAPEVFTKDYR